MWPCIRTGQHHGSLHPLAYTPSNPKKLGGIPGLSGSGRASLAGLAGAGSLCLSKGKASQRLMQRWTQIGCLAEDSLVAVAEDESKDGRGRRLVAVCRVSSGTEILEEGPAFAVSRDVAMDGVSSKLQDLSPAVQESLLKLCHSSNLPADEQASIVEIAGSDSRLLALLRVFLINSIGTPKEGSAIYLRASRANHSCQPNAAFQIDKANQLHLVTLRPLECNEEIFVSYLPEATLLRPQGVRRHLLEKWGFKCSCSRCQSKDDVRTFLCGHCGHGAIRPTTLHKEDDVLWCSCSACGAEPQPSRELAEAEELWQRQLKRFQREPSGRGILESLRTLQQPSSSRPLPSLQGHWVAAAIADLASQVLPSQGHAEEAEAAAMWSWRFARRTFQGASSRRGAEALAARAGISALRALSERDAGHAAAACRRYARAMK
ncbi:unnamed protein product, partial [Symbiodinium microadriaticum]